MITWRNNNGTCFFTFKKYSYINDDDDYDDDDDDDEKNPKS